MGQPRSIDPVEWANYNAELAKAGVFELVPYEVQENELLPPVRELTLAVRRAVSDLEGTSEKGDRIALQLLTALARFSQETGL